MSNVTRRPATLALSAIVPSRFGRPHVEDGGFAALVRSVERVGILQRPVVREAANGKFELVFGSRRVAAARKAGLERIAVDLVPLSDGQSAVWGLVENLARAGLHPIALADLLWRAAQHLHEAEDGAGGRPPALSARRAARLLAVHTRLAPDTLRKMMAVLPDNPALRAALRRRALDVEQLRLAQAIARLGRQRPDETERWWVGIALNAARHRWTVAALRGARDALKQHDRSDLETVKDKIKALARGDVRPEALHEFRDLSGGFRLRHKCPKCGFEFN